ncbi:hypothetical protein [Edaphocola flava]|uniref:hypothetical protein n=1 Tax=Edaphocola flava TaxID=2499629 RepID=UPI00100BF7CF|nr:hypothetical protein [Edaphocola flava]
MKGLKSTFDSAELRVLYNVFGMLKYGIDDEQKMLKVISSPIFKELFTEIHCELINHLNDRALSNNQRPVTENIEEYPSILNTLKSQVKKCIEMYSNIEDYDWASWPEKDKKDLVINLASPYSVNDTTIDEILNKKN